MAKISGCYKFVEEVPILNAYVYAKANFKVNGIPYIEIYIVSVDSTMVMVFDKNDNVYAIYLEGAGWFAPIHTDEMSPVFQPNPHMRVIDFGEEEQEVSDDFFAALNQCAVRVYPTNIEYNGNTIATIADGESVALRCAGKTMKTDIVVTSVDGTLVLSGGESES